MNTQQVAQDVAQTPAMRHNPTPRTDAAVISSGFQVVPQEFSRQLEIEITAVREQLAENTLLLNSWIDTSSTFLVRAERAEAECLEQARLLGMSGNQVVALQRPLLRLTSLWHQLFFLLDITEESDSGNVFRPNYISSCRAVDGDRIQKILEEAKQLINANVKTEHL